MNNWLQKWKQLLGIVLFALFLGEFLFLVMDNPVIFPSPWMVLAAMKEQLQTTIFYKSIFFTVTRVVFGIAMSFFFGAMLAFWRFFYPKTRIWLDYLILLLRSIPNITLMILFLFWLGGEQSLFLVIFLVLFPVVYQACADELETIQTRWKDVLEIYPQPRRYLLRQVYIPLLKPALGSALISITSLGFKVGVMAEILSQVRGGIGRNMQIAKLNVDLASLLAWTIWFLIVVAVCEWIIKKTIATIMK